MNMHYQVGSFSVTNRRWRAKPWMEGNVLAAWGKEKSWRTSHAPNRASERASRIRGLNCWTTSYREKNRGLEISRPDTSRKWQPQVWILMTSRCIIFKQHICQVGKLLVRSNEVQKHRGGCNFSKNRNWQAEAARNVGDIFCLLPLKCIMDTVCPL